MKDNLLDFLRELEVLIPPADKCHHAITRAQYGSDEAGREDKLAIQVNDARTLRIFFFDAEDFGKRPAVLAHEIAQQVKALRQDALAALESREAGL